MRDPKHCPAPTGIEDRRMAIYRDLIFNNIEGFLSSGFPIVRELHSDEEWQTLVRDFIIQHQSHTPYFLQISQEFLTYLQNRPLPEDKPFLVELAHYEWVELALDVSSETIPSENKPCDLLEQTPRISPLAWNLSYQFPVHRISREFQPIETPDSPTFLVVYRNRKDEIGFMESNAATSRLLHLLETGESDNANTDPNANTNTDPNAAAMTGQQVLETLAQEMAAPDTNAIVRFGLDILKKLQSLDIVYYDH